jgi:hypothetical protein
MAGLVPAIHVFVAAKFWMPGTSPGHDGSLMIAQTKTPAARPGFSI